MSVDEERAGQALRSLMRAVELPPSRTETEPVEELVPRRIGRMPVVAGVVGVAGVLATVVVGIQSGVEPDQHGATAAVGTAKCKRVQPPTVPGFRNIRIHATDPSGRYVAGMGLPEGGGARRMLLWQDGEETEATPVDIPSESEPVDVNSTGVVVGGLRSNPPDKSVAWVYRDGQLRTLLPPSGFQYVSAAAVNERGDVAGTAAGPGDTWAAVVWPAATPETAVALHAPSVAVAEDITDDGTVVGNLYQSGSSVGSVNTGQAYTWSADGTGRQLETPTRWAAGKALGVHGDWIYGYTHQGTQAEINVRPSGPFVIDRAPVRWRLDGGDLAEMPAQAQGPFVSWTNIGWWLEDKSGPLLITVDGQGIPVDLGDSATNGSLRQMDTWMSGFNGGDFVLYANLSAPPVPDEMKPVPTPMQTVRWACSIETSR
jgi:hypothetical protein